MLNSSIASSTNPGIISEQLLAKIKHVVSSTVDDFGQDWRRTPSPTQHAAPSSQPPTASSTHPTHLPHTPHHTRHTHQNTPHTTHINLMLPKTVKILELRSKQRSASSSHHGRQPLGQKHQQKHKGHGRRAQVEPQVVQNAPWLRFLFRHDPKEYIKKVIHIVGRADTKARMHVSVAHRLSKRTPVATPWSETRSTSHAKVIDKDTVQAEILCVPEDPRTGGNSSHH